MARTHLIEFHDQSWCPPGLRDAFTDFLQHSVDSEDIFTNIVPILRQALDATGESRIIDLGSGAGGPWRRLHPRVYPDGEKSLEVLLTDRFPNKGAIDTIAESYGPQLNFHPTPVDARAVPEELAGFRTMFHSFHHFTPPDARLIFLDAVRQKRGIGIFEATERRPLSLAIQFLLPFLVLLKVPSIRPFKWSRLLWTYLIPVLPPMMLFDGFVSCLRSYSPAELKAMIDSVEAADFEWKIGHVKVPSFPVRVTYAIGYPSPPSRPS